MSARVLLCCGSGGVGKTTLSASLAVHLAAQGRRVCVLTIDPARRLADSLGIGQLNNEARPVPLEGLAPAAGARLDALMLDASATFDSMVHRLASSPASAQRILANRYYRFAAARLGGVHEYMAQERLLELYLSEEYDIIVVDTPPTRHALDFLKAPDRMAGLMDQGVLRWLVMPATSGGWRALELGSEVISRVLRTLLGQGTVAEIAEFFEAIRDLWDAFRERSLRVKALLSDSHTRFLLITSPAPAARAEALFFLDMLRERRLPFGGFIVNRVLPPLPALPEPALMAEAGASPALIEALGQVHRQHSQLAATQAAAIAELQRAAPREAPVWTIPDQPRDLHDLAGLAGLGPHLPQDLWGE